MRSAPIPFFEMPAAKSCETFKEAPATSSLEDRDCRFERVGPILIAWLALYVIAIVGSLGEIAVTATAELQAGFDPILIAGLP